MTTATPAGSAFPRTVDDLIPHARDLAETLGALPSRNKLMKTFKVGADKANALLAELTTTPAAPVAVDVPDDPAPIEPPAVPAAVDTVDTPDDTATVNVPAVIEVAPPVQQEKSPITWPVLILCLPAFVAIWGGWVEMGRLTGFGKVTLLPGIFDSFQLNTAITLPIGVETYAAYALFVWLSGRATGDARRFAKWSALASLGLGALGQVAYHLMAAASWESAPWPITAAVSCIPVAVLGMGAALAHLMHKN